MNELISPFILILLNLIYSLFLLSSWTNFISFYYFLCPHFPWYSYENLFFFIYYFILILFPQLCPIAASFFTPFHSFLFFSHFPSSDFLFFYSPPSISPPNFAFLFLPISFCLTNNFPVLFAFYSFFYPLLFLQPPLFLLPLFGIINISLHFSHTLLFLIPLLSLQFTITDNFSILMIGKSVEHQWFSQMIL